MAQRPSVYLQEKVANFKQTLGFFASNQGSTRVKLKEKRLVFLAQIGFWDWEIDTLIYSFTTFDERCLVWSGGHELERMLVRQGILVKPKVLAEVQLDQCWHHRNEVTAPVADLNRLIDAWNGLLEACETVLRYDAEEMHALKADYLPSLEKYRKARLPE